MTGMLPQLLGCTSLTLLNFGFNQVSVLRHVFNSSSEWSVFSNSFFSNGFCVQFSGVVPSNWNTFVLLKTATLLYNQLESPVTPFFTLPLLEQLDLSHNRMSPYTKFQ